MTNLILNTVYKKQKKLENKLREETSLGKKTSLQKKQCVQIKITQEEAAKNNNLNLILLTITNTVPPLHIKRNL